MSTSFGIKIKFNVLYETGNKVQIAIMRETVLYLERCALIILRDPENQFNKEATKCAGRLFKTASNIREKARELAGGRAQCQE